MTYGGPGLVLAVVFIANCVDVVPTTHAAEGYWSYESLGVGGAYSNLFHIWGGWICRTIDDNGKARVGAYDIGSHACLVNEPRRDYALPNWSIITDVNKFQFLLNDGVTKSYAWIANKDVKSLDGAIEAGSAASQEKTFICRGYYGAHGARGQPIFIQVLSGTYYPSKGVCDLPKPHIAEFDILFDLYSMCDNNLTNPNSSKEGTWSGTFNAGEAVRAGPDIDEDSYVCRVRKDSQIFLGKTFPSNPACYFANADHVESSRNQEVLVSTPSSFYGWAPHSMGIIDGATIGAVATNGTPVFICRAFADTGYQSPLSPGAIISTAEECVTTVENRVSRSTDYEVLVDMRRTCADRQSRRGLRSGIVKTNTAYSSIPRSGPLKSSAQLSAPNDAIKNRKWQYFLSESNYGDSDEFLERGLNALKLTLDTYSASSNSF